MAHRLSIKAQQAIPAGGAWPRLCTNVVVCWLWWAANNPRGGAAAVAIDPVAFGNFLTGGAFVRSTPRFLGGMATSRGRERSQPIFGSLSPWKGSLVLWVSEGGTAEHACINGGNNTLYGYNQSGYLTGCNHGTIHCNHPTSAIKWENYAVYTVKPDTAITYFNNNVNTAAKW